MSLASSKHLPTVTTMMNKEVSSLYVERGAFVLAFLSLLTYAIHLNNQQQEKIELARIRIEIAEEQLRVAQSKIDENIKELIQLGTWMAGMDAIKREVEENRTLSADRWRKTDMREWANQLRTNTGLSIPEVK